MMIVKVYTLLPHFGRVSGLMGKEAWALDQPATLGEIARHAVFAKAFSFGVNV